jgi:hypothetical protein
VVDPCAIDLKEPTGWLSIHIIIIPFRVLALAV